jgi:hypothetical protein
LKNFANSHQVLCSLWESSEFYLTIVSRPFLGVKRPSIFVSAFLFLAFIFGQDFEAHAQCAYGGTNYGDVTPAGVGSTFVLANYVWGGDQYSLSAVAGCSYTISTCGGGWDSQITVFNPSLAAVAYNDDFLGCGFQSQVTFTAAVTGVYTIQVNLYNCTWNLTNLPYFGVTLNSCAGGCNNPAACNYMVGGTDPTACCNDNCLTLQLFDSFGDGWNGATYSVANDAGTVLYSGTLATGSTSSVSLCLPDGCYSMYAGGGTFDSEISWSITGTDAGTASGGAPQTVGFGINASADCTIIGDAIIVDASTYSASELITDVFLGDCLEASNITFTGALGAIGSFSNGSSIGIEEGIILTSGSAISAPGPNLSGSTTTDNFFPGSALLDAAAGGTTLDAATFTFDFVASTTQVAFTYVFASEEYPEYVCSSFNDAFGFFISGPGYTGTQNVATVPGTSDIVSIDNVNNNGAGCPPFYPAYYVDNTGGVAVEYDGYTVPLETVINTVPCETYQITIAIADMVDGLWDSAVFLQAQSFSAGIDVEVAATAASGTQSTAIDCEESGSFLFVNNGAPFTEVTTINFTISGDAVGGVDYAPISTSVTFQPGESFVQLDIAGLIADLTSTPETLVITLTESCTCSAPPTASLFLCLQIMLPIELTDFRGAQTGKAITLDWQTHSEINSSHFVVLRSSDNIHWDKVGAHEAAGESYLPISYQLKDPDPVLGVNYYRLLMVDRDGQSEFSETIAVEFETDGQWEIFPIPAEDVLQIRLEVALDSELQLLSADGRLIKTLVVDRDMTHYSIDLTSLQPGVYVVQWLAEGTLLESKRIVVY